MTTKANSGTAATIENNNEDGDTALTNNSTVHERFASLSTTLTTTTQTSQLERLYTSLCPYNPKFCQKALQFFLIGTLQLICSQFYNNAIQTLLRPFTNDRETKTITLKLVPFWRDLVVILVGLVGVGVWNSACRKRNKNDDNNNNMQQHLPSFLYLYGPPAFCLVLAFWLSDFTHHHGQVRPAQILNATTLFWFIGVGKIVHPSANVYSWMRYAQVVTFTALTLWLKIEASQSSSVAVSSWMFLGIFCVAFTKLCVAWNVQWCSFIWKTHGQGVSVWHVMVGAYILKLPCTVIRIAWQGNLVNLLSTQYFEMTGGYIPVAGWFALYTLSMFWMIRHLGPIAIAFSILILSTRYSIQAVRPPIPNTIIAGMFLWLATLLWVAVWEFVDQRRRWRDDQGHIVGTPVLPNFKDRVKHDNDEEKEATEAFTWVNKEL